MHRLLKRAYKIEELHSSFRPCKHPFKATRFWKLTLFTYPSTRLLSCLTPRRRAVIHFLQIPSQSISRRMSRKSSTTSLDGACICLLSGSPALKYTQDWTQNEVDVCSLCLSILLSTLETSIVSTSLVSIADALHRFDQSGWIVTSYLLTYTGTLSYIIIPPFVNNLVYLGQ